MTPTEVVGNLIFILLLVFVNGFFVAAEFAIVRVRRTQLEERAMKGHRRAGLAKHIVDHLDSYLSATQLGITLASLFLGWIGEPILADILRGPFESIGLVSDRTLHAIAFILSFALLTFLTITLGELGPKYLALQYTEETALLVSVPLQLFYRVFRPFIWVLNRSSNYLLSWVGIPPTRTYERLHSAEELELIVSEGARSGMLDKTEQELISRIFEFSTTMAREVMVPRTEVIAVDIATPRERLVRIVTDEGYSRLPVFKDSIDNIIGIIYTKDLISMLEHRDLIVLQDVLRPPYFVPGTVRISRLMRELQDQKLHMAVVVDEFGGTEGIITMEDILEEIVGEIHDEYDEVRNDVEPSADGTAMVNGNITIGAFNDQFGAVIPEDPEYDTLNGFLYKMTGSIPDLNEEYPYKNLVFTVVKRSHRRIRQVKVRKAAPASP